MKIFFSESTIGFYYDVIHKNIPEDSVEISETNYLEIMNKQANGYSIIVAENGYPITTSEVENNTTMIILDTIYRR